MGRIKDDGEHGDTFICGFSLLLSSIGGVVKYHYDTLMKGVAATMSDSLVNSFRQDDIVDFIG